MLVVISCAGTEVICPVIILGAENGFLLTVWEYQSLRGDLCGRAILIRYDDSVLAVLY